MALIQGNQVTSVDQLLPLLPQSYRSKFALMLQSGSLQSASSASPRVIAYGDTLPEEAIYPGQNNDRLYIAFQTDKTSQSKLPNSLEVIEWQPKTRDYKFYQLDFPLSGNPVAVNPDSCKDCHGDPLHQGNPLRPNWTAYSRWDGALGNNNGLTGSFDANFYPSQDEANKVVDGIQNGNDRLKAFDLSAFKVIGKIENPAANMSDKIGQQLQMRDINVIRSSPDYDRFKYAFAGAFLGCVNYSDFFDARLQDSLQQGVYANLAFVPKTLDTTQEDLSYAKLWQMTGPLIEKNGTHFGGYSEEVAITTWLRFLLEGRSNAVLLKNLLGTPPFDTVNVPQWTYDFVGFGDRSVGLSEMYLKYTSSDFPGFDNLYELGTQERSYVYTKYNTETTMPTDNGPAASTCQQLASKSRAATAGYVVPTASAPQLVQTTSAPLDSTGGTALFQKYCTTCHGAGGDIVLPLDNLDKLKAYRTSAGRSISQRLLGKEMPPPVWPVQPTDDERNAMIGALNN
jgi:cytochrome c5